MIITETERLELHEFVIDDALFILKLVNNPTWIEFIGNRNINTKNEAINYLLNGPINSYKKNGFGGYLIRLKKTGDPIGMCGLFKRDGLDNADIGFALLPDYSNKGYAFEASSAVLVYARKTLKMKRVAAITSSNNTNSINLIKKLGLHFEKMIKLPNDEKECMLFMMEEK